MKLSPENGEPNAMVGRDDPKRRRSFWLVLAAAILALAVLAAIGYAVWQNHGLTSEVAELRVLLTSTSRPTATTALDPWAGYDKAAYAQAFSSLRSRRADIFEQLNSASNYETKWKNFSAGQLDLTDSLESFPLGPAEVLAAQDAYYAAVLEACSQANGFNPASSSDDHRAALLRALQVEWQTVSQWNMVLERFGIDLSSLQQGGTQGTQETPLFGDDWQNPSGPWDSLP
jgi:hypothetical protein